MKKIISVLTLILISFSSLFALGVKEEKEIVLWHSFKGVKSEALNSLIDSYNKEHDVKVKLVYQGKTTDLNTKLRASMVSLTNMPNIAQLDASSIYDVINCETLIDASTLIENDESFSKDTILSNALDSQMYKNRLLGLPFNASSIVLYYNKTLFDKLKLTVPSTFEELSTVCKVIKEKEDIYGLSNTFTTYEMVSLVGQQNGYTPITNNNNGHSGLATKVLFDQNSSIENIIKAYQKIYKTDALHLVSSSSSVKEFITSKTAMILASTSKLTTIENSCNFEVGVSFLPKLNDNATGGVNVSGGALYVFDSNDSNLNKEAWNVVKYLTNKESQLTFHKKTGYFPINTETYKLDEFKKLAKENPNLEVSVKQVLNSNPKLVSVWWHNSYPIYMEISNSSKKAIEENTDPKEYSLYLADKINSYLE